MRRYRSVSMDDNDAALLVLAEVLTTSYILTLDRRGFLVYRWSDRRAFRISP